MHSTGTNPSRLTPQSTGVYQVVFHGRLNNNLTASTGNAYGAIMDSSGAQLARMDILNGGAGAGVASWVVVGYKRFDEASDTQWVRVETRVRDGSTQSLSTLAFFAMHKL